MITSQHLEIMDRAIKIWGTHAQKMMAVGECGEFLAEFGREVQHRSSQDKMIDEIADVIIMMTQMARIYGYEEVVKRVQEKMDKVVKKLDKEKDPGMKLEAYQ